MDRSPAMVMALLGILKTGGLYVPLDPSYPDKRLAFMCEDSQAKLLLVDDCTTGRLPSIHCERLNLDNPLPILLSAVRPPGVRPFLDSAVYVVYTSGRPDDQRRCCYPSRLGQLSETGLCRHIQSPQTWRSSHSSIAFDLTMTSLFAPPWLAGGVARSGIELSDV